jgi:hypothetical protein
MYVYVSTVLEYEISTLNINPVIHTPQTSIDICTGVLVSYVRNVGQPVHGSISDLGRDACHSNRFWVVVSDFKVILL